MRSRVPFRAIGHRIVGVIKNDGKPRIRSAGEGTRTCGEGRDKSGIKTTRAPGRSGNVDWWDPFIGGRATLPLGESWKFKLRADVGGFGIGSDLAWQVETLFTRDFSPRASFEIGYRWIDVDYQDDDNGFIFDVMTQRPQAGVNFRF